MYVRPIVQGYKKKSYPEQTVLVVCVQNLRLEFADGRDTSEMSRERGEGGGVRE